MVQKIFTSFLFFQNFCIVLNFVAIVNLFDAKIIPLIVRPLVPQTYIGDFQTAFTTSTQAVIFHSKGDRKWPFPVESCLQRKQNNF